MRNVREAAAELLLVAELIEARVVEILDQMIRSNIGVGYRSPHFQLQIQANALLLLIIRIP